jgi:hypothetical protein
MFLNWYTWIVASMFASMAIGSAIGHHVCRPIEGTILGLLGPPGWLLIYFWKNGPAMRERDEWQQKQRYAIQYAYEQYLKSQASQIVQRNGVIQTDPPDQPSPPSEPPIASPSLIPSPPVASSAPLPVRPASTEKRVSLRWRPEESA